MSVRFKFKNDLEHTALPCDGFHISVLDLKRAIIRLKRLGRVTDFDLDVINQQDNQPFESEEALIPKNSTLVIVRKPLPAGQQKTWEEEKLTPSLRSGGGGSSLSFGPGSDQLSEEDKLTAMMSNSTEMYDQKNWLKLKGRANYPSKTPPAAYRCIKCNLGGHWVTECPNTRTGFLGSELKRTTGIPRSFLKPALKDTPGAKINPQGLYMVNELEERAYVEKKIDKPVWENEDDLKTENPKTLIPNDLICPVCKDILKDCIMMPECACPICDECARNALIESEDNACPACATPGNSPDELIPWRQIRDKVNKFKNTMAPTGTNVAQHSTKAMPPQEKLLPTLPDITLPGQHDFDYVAGTKPSPVYGLSPGVSSTGTSPTTTPALVENLATAAEPLIPSDGKSPGTPLEMEKDSPARTPSPLQSRLTSASRSPKRRRSTSGTPPDGEQPRSRAVPLPDTSQPPPGFAPPVTTQFVAPAVSHYPSHASYSSHDGHQHHHQYSYHHRGGRSRGRIEKENGYIVDPLKAFEILMERRDREKGRIRSPVRQYSPGRYDHRSSHRYSRRPGSPGPYRRPHSPGYHPRSRSPYGRTPPQGRTPPVRSPHSSPKRSPRGPRTPPPPASGETPPVPGTLSPRRDEARRGSLPRDGPRTPPPPRRSHSRDEPYSADRLSPRGQRSASPRVRRGPPTASAHSRSRTPPHALPRHRPGGEKPYDHRDSSRYPHPPGRREHSARGGSSRHLSPADFDGRYRLDDPRSKSQDNRTPSLSPEPNHEHHELDMRHHRRSATAVDDHHHSRYEGHRELEPRHREQEPRHREPELRRREPEPRHREPEPRHREPESRHHARVREDRYADDRRSRKQRPAQEKGLRKFQDRLQEPEMSRSRPSRDGGDRHRSSRADDPRQRSQHPYEGHESKGHPRDYYDDRERNIGRDALDRTQVLAEKEEHLDERDIPRPRDDGATLRAMPSPRQATPLGDRERKRKDKKKRKKREDGIESELSESEELASKKRKKKTKKVKAKVNKHGEDHVRDEPPMEPLQAHPVAQEDDQIEGEMQSSAMEKAISPSPEDESQSSAPHRPSLANGHELQTRVDEHGEDQGDQDDALEIAAKIDLDEPEREGSTKEDVKSKWDSANTDDDEGKSKHESDIRKSLKSNDEAEDPSEENNDEDRSAKKKKKKKKLKKKSKAQSGSESEEGAKKKKKKKKDKVKEKKFAELKKELLMLKQQISTTQGSTRRSTSRESDKQTSMQDYDNIKVTIARSPPRSPTRPANRERGRDRRRRTQSPVIANKLMEMSGTRVSGQPPPPKRKSVKDRLGPIPSKPEASARPSRKSQERWESNRARDGRKDELPVPHKRRPDPRDDDLRPRDRKRAKPQPSASPARRDESPRNNHRSRDKRQTSRSPERRKEVSSSKGGSSKAGSDRKRREDTDKKSNRDKNEKSDRKSSPAPGRESPVENRGNPRFERNRSRFEDEANFEPNYEGDSD